MHGAPPLGLRMPADTGPHERTLMGWPTGVRRGFWSDRLDAARAAWAEVAVAIAGHEPVTMIVDPPDAAGAEAAMGAVRGVEVVELPIDDSWLRDTGPVVVTDPADPSRRVAVHFGFNAWGGLVSPWERDSEVASLAAELLGLAVTRAPFVLEGGSVVVDGEGLAVTTQHCLLHPNRGELPGGEPRTEAAMERLLGDWLGIERVVWLRDGLEDDTDTDGHVDNVVALPRPGVALLQGCSDPDDADAATAADSRRRLAAAGQVVVELTELPRVECMGRQVEVPYVNLYAGNGFVVVPVTGHPYDDEALATIAALYPGREVIDVPGAVIAFGGGGPHCITQQIPAMTQQVPAVPPVDRSPTAGTDESGSPWN